MQTRRDQVQAHLFVSGRLVSAMMRAEPDAPHTPMRRFSVGTFAGVLLAIVGVAGFAVFGFIKPGGAKAWRQPGALVVEKETGAQYLFAGGELRPVLNYTSARLILGNNGLRVVNTSRRSLKGVPHGLPVGIESAPDYLPDPQALTGTEWQICSALRPDRTGADRPFVTLHIARAGAGSPLGVKHALVVRTPDEAIYLAWENRRLRIPDVATLTALGYGAARQYPVGFAWINALPAGPDLAAPKVAERGRPGPPIRGKPTRIGQLFEVVGAPNGEQFFLVTREGLAPLTPTGAALIVGGTGTRPTRVSMADLAEAPRAGQTLINAGLPPTPPEAVSANGAEVPCLQATVGTDAGANIRLALATPDIGPPADDAAAGDEADPSRPSALSGLADKISVEPGTGLLVRALPAPGVTTGTEYLLVDTGVRYPVPTDEVAGTLGYGGIPAIPVPTALLGLIPAGRPLDPEAAKAGAPLAQQADLNRLGPVEVGG